MSPAAKSLFVFGIYAIAAGAAIDLAAAAWTAIALRQAS